MGEGISYSISSPPGMLALIDSESQSPPRVGGCGELRFRRSLHALGPEVKYTEAKPIGA